MMARELEDRRKRSYKKTTQKALRGPKSTFLGARRSAAGTHDQVTLVSGNTSLKAIAVGSHIQPSQPQTAIPSQ